MSRGLPRAAAALALCCTLAGAPWAPPARAQAAPAASAPEASQEALEAEDRRRMEPRAYPLGPVARVTIGRLAYRDADGRRCAARPAPRITERQVRRFLARAVPVSQVAVMNYYGVHGECVSDPVQVRFADGRRVHLAFAADSGVAYLSPLSGTRETDVFFYHCEDCAP